LDIDVVVAARRSAGGALVSSGMALEYEAVCCRKEHEFAVAGGIQLVRDDVDDLVLLAEEV
jgi:hypothetical protein